MKTAGPTGGGTGFADYLAAGPNRGSRRTREPERKRSGMTGCLTGGMEDLLRRLDAAVEALAPRLAELVAEVSPDEDVVTTREDGTVVMTAPVRFPDGIGRGTVRGGVFRYRTGVRVDITVTHNRVIALADGRPTDRACFLNDFKASTTLGPEATTLPDRFVAQVRDGVRAALSAVEEHNRRHPQPWSRIHVTVREAEMAAR